MKKKIKSHVANGKRKYEVGSCEKCRHLNRGTRVADVRLPQTEDV